MAKTDQGVYTEKKFWDGYFQKFEPKKIDSVVFADIFEKFLPKDRNKTVLEIGCAGGTFLAYLAKRFGYRAYGIDYSDEIDTTYKTFAYNDLPAPTLFKEDLTRWKHEPFDIVASFGFVEHFSDLKKILSLHADLVKPGGSLVITMPHFAHGQHLVHWLIDRENLKIHNINIMNLKAVQKAITELGLTIEYLSYYRTFDFWTEKRELTILERASRKIITLLRKGIIKVFGENRPNPFLSPYIVCVAKRPENAL